MDGRPCSRRRSDWRRGRWALDSNGVYAAAVVGPLAARPRHCRLCGTALLSKRAPWPALHQTWKRDG
ncbi:hypothetical protein BU14_0396s0012 [Porphyra umbilicalis]|uniref:Uncharacterized protein n=1 Tax=Porphyra umbilicalis TaxID=2786 RepID=A0A1X6NWK7_PORUM|nr:hypothetical protein BU14_0396s0012 [Porphyra umbilicalis]|eukprot:OSX72910.1 hypothetical protein BU14_0396s0012 [Porphyra umbilicalis]